MALCMFVIPISENSLVKLYTTVNATLGMWQLTGYLGKACRNKKLGCTEPEQIVLLHQACLLFMA
jgi:hypothetical protein